MRLSLFRLNRPPSDAIDTAEVDVTPIMNMFIILIPFLVSMAVFTHVSIIEFSVPPGDGPGMAKEKPKIKLTVRVGTDYLGIVAGANLLDSIPVNQADMYDRLAKALTIRRDEAEIRDEVIVASVDAVQFQWVVKVMDICKEAGFEKIGISSATLDPDAIR